MRQIVGGVTAGAAHGSLRRSHPPVPPPSRRVPLPARRPPRPRARAPPCSTVGAAVAAAAGAELLDADGLHPPANIAKMAGGAPLSDADRLPWLRAVRAEVASRAAA
jgi:hypothetical protein